MAERVEQQKDQDKENGRETKRSSAAERSGETAIRGVGRTARQGLQFGAEIAARSGEMTAAATHRHMRDAAEGSREMTRMAADEMGDFGRTLAETTHETSEDLRLLMSLPGFGGGLASGVEG